jgi:hypothetical protein
LIIKAFPQAYQDFQNGLIVGFRIFPPGAAVMPYIGLKRFTADSYPLLFPFMGEEGDGVFTVISGGSCELVQDPFFSRLVCGAVSNRYFACKRPSLLHSKPHSLCQNSKNRNVTAVYSGTTPHNKTNNTIYAKNNEF